MTTVVDLSNGNTYLASLFVWCMSGAPRVFDGKRTLMMSLFVWSLRVVDGYLTCARDEFACVVHV